jgi:uncharacterized repeat protein (TIGR01451 family)
MSTSSPSGNNTPVCPFSRSNIRLVVFLVLFISVGTLSVIAVSSQSARERTVAESGGTQNKHLEADTPHRYSRFGLPSLALFQAQNPSATPVTGSLTPAQPPNNMPLNAAANSSSPDGQININFDNVPGQTVVTNQYPPAVFSTNAPWWVETQDQRYYGSSSPNYLDRGPYVYPHGYAPLYVDFTSPVNNLRFFIVGADNATTIAQINIFQNRQITATRNLIGRGDPNLPTLIDIGAVGFNNVTRIEIVNINDPNGIGFDDFSFTLAASPSPTPTPVPSPTPPSTPRDLIATPDEEEISLSWTPSQGASWYVIERAETPVTGSASTNAAAPEGLAFSPIAPSFTCDGAASPCLFPDSDSGNGLNSDTRYFYTVTAVNASGSSAGAEASNVPLPKPGCSASPTPAPAHGAVGNFGWTMQYDFTPNDGLVISEIYLNGKRMAKQMSVPYYRINTFTAANPNTQPRRGELTPVATGNSLRSRLVDYKINPADPNKILIEADYAIDHIPDTPKACLNITQKYEFYRAGASPPDLGGPCEPSDTVHPCNKFRPMIEYSFHGESGEFLRSLNTPIRLHFQNTDASGNTVALTRDYDELKDALSHPTLPFAHTFNPLSSSWISQVILQRSPTSPNKDANTVDNFHQTNDKIAVTLPGLTGHWETLPFPHWTPDNVDLAGCPECVHFHWRWSKFAGPNFMSGRPIIPPTSDQAVDIEVVPFKNVFENFHPTDYYQTLFHAGDPLRNPQKGINQPYDVVFWYSPTGFQPSDTFFWHTAWFTPIKLNVPSTVSLSAPSGNTSTPASSPDGPISVTFGSLYETGTTTFTTHDLSVVPSLPPGYAALNNAAYFIDTTASVSGPHVVNFSAASVSDQNDFNNLRIFYLEPDPFDPEKAIWVDATILSPDVPAPDFSAQTLSGKSNRLGVYVIGKLVETVPPNPDVANLRVSCTDSADPVVAGDDLTYTITVTNDGPQSATEVFLKNPLSPDVDLISTTTSQGTCKELAGVVYCSINTLASGASATVTLVVRPTEGTGSFPIEGKMIANTATITAKETDTDASNDSFTEATLVMPSSHKPPVVTITSPVVGNMYVGPVDITINAVATDSDGTITKVDFFDNDELLGAGTPGAGNSFSFTKFNAPFGNHSFVAVATDNGGRQNLSSTVDVVVNGMATVSVTSPAAGTFASPGSNITLGAAASHPSGVINQVEFFANGDSIGNGIVTSGTQYQLSWNDVRAGNYAIVAIATDNSGVTTVSAPINITVDTSPTVSITSPVNGTAFPSATNFSVFASAQSAVANVARIDFYANGMFIGSASDVGTTNFGFTWRHMPDGFYSLTAVATDSLGVSTTSAPITIGVNTPSPQAGEFIWFDDELTTGAIEHGEDTANKWYWVDANPGAFSGSKSHQSRNFAQVDPSNGFHKHYFDGATSTLPLGAGDKLFTYVFLDVNNLPREIMLEWKDANGWEHRAYWGQNTINLGTDGTDSRRYMGSLPRAGTWTRLEVPASSVGLEGATLNGMSFALDGGRATFDLAGKATANATPRPTTPVGDTVWVEDGPPAGSVTSVVDDVWNLVSVPLYSGQSAHQSYFRNNDVVQYRSHSFTNAQAMQVNPGDVLFTYVYLGDPDPTHQSFTPDQIMLQWFDGTSWNHRAFWGENYIGQQIANVGVQDTEGQRYMGGLPKDGRSGGCGIPNHPGWCRLEVPASYVGLEGKSVTGMAFSSFRNGKNPFVTWDRSGKSSQLSSVPLPLSATTGVWRLFSAAYGYSFETNDQGSPEHVPQKKNAFYVHPNQAAGTVPMYRFRKPTNYEYFYTQCRTCLGADWQFEGIAFYVYPDASTPATVPLYLYHDSHFHYFLTTDQSEATGMALDGVWAYVPNISPVAPAAPNFLQYDSCYLNWHDNAWDEVGFKIERLDIVQQNGFPVGVWNQIATVPTDTVSFKIGCNVNSGTSYRVRAYNSFGDSAYSNDTCVGCLYIETDPGNRTPDIAIVSPQDADVVDHNFAITANASDRDGNGTIAKVEFFANGNKLGEVTNAPYVYPWSNAPLGTYSLTTIVTDNAGATTTSIPVNITVGMSNQTIAFDQIPDKTYGDAPFTISASASSGLPVTFSIVSGPATISGSTVTITGVGPVTIQAAQAGDGNYNAAPNVNSSFTVTKSSQTITFNALGNKTYGDTPFAVSGSSTSGLPMSFSITSGPATIAGSTVTLSGAGTVTVRASQSGNENYNAAANVDQSFTAAKASATITLTNLNQNYDGTPKTVTATTNPSGLSGVSIKYAGSSTAPSNAGSYSAVASLTNDNYTATDATGTLIINALPTVSITSPTSGSSLTGTSVNISASAADSDGSVSKVEFFRGSIKLGEVAAAPFSFVWNNVAGGSYSLTAVASDNSGGSTVSSPVSITVNNPPTVSITASSPQDSPTAPAQITINASASDGDGTISKVEFYQGTTLLATSVTSPYTYTWSNVGAGSYSITAKATDNLGAVTTSNVVGISVNAKPTVSLTSPGNGASFIAPAFVSVSATASDSDGSIDRVDFYQGATLIGTNHGSPYNFNWTYVPAGTYTLTAKAYDNRGAVTTSNSVVITINTTIGKIAFASNRDGCAQIYLMNTDGTGQLCLSNGASNDESPKWSPDNTRIVFQSDRDFQGDSDNPIYGTDIYVMNGDGSGVTRLTFAAYDDGAPVWSPDGTKIAFQSFRNGVNSQIYVMNADGSGQVNISNTSANDIEPSWSPDGTKIAFASDRDQSGFSSIYVMNANGSNQIRLTSSGSGFLDEQPAWSPDGTKLAFTTTRDSATVAWQLDNLGQPKLLINKEVYVMNADGSSQVRLTNNMGNDESPVWSPDGTKIVFRSDRDRDCCDPVSQIWVMNADGSNQTILSNTNFGDYCPSWSH